MKTKQELEQAIVMLEERIVSSTSEMVSVQADLKQALGQLKDINKPELTGEQLDDIENAIYNSVDNFDFNDSENYDTEFELDYDGRVQLSTLDFSNTQELIECITETVHKLFKEIESND